MKRVSNLINGFIMACFLVLPHQVLADSNQCSTDIEKAEITILEKGSDSKINITGSLTLTVPLITIGGQPRFENLSLSSDRDDLWELTYRAGSAGTSTIVSESRRVIINPCQDKILGEGVYQRTAEGKKGEEKWDQPQWIWGADNLYVLDRDYGNQIISLPPEKLIGPNQFQDYKVSFNPNQNWEDLPTTPFENHHHPYEVKAALSADEYPNFSGHFKLMYFGCGTGCSGLGFLDKESGVLFEPDFVVHRGFQQQTRMIQYRVDSGLIVVNGALSEGGNVGTYYFHFDGKNFIKLP